MILIVAEDRQADAALQSAIAAARAGGTPFAVLTGDALLMMRLHREGIDARLPLDAFTRAARIEEGDRLALAGAASAVGEYATFDGTPFGPYFEYTLIPSFVRAVRNVIAVDDAVSGLATNRVVLAGGGALVQAAHLVARHRRVPIERISGDIVSRAIQAIGRLRAGRATRWVNTEFRALVLEPGFLALLFTKAFFRRLLAPAPPAVQQNAIIVAADRFTKDVIDRLRGDARQIVLAGATQPGRALFEDTPSLVPIEDFSRPGDLLRTIGTSFDAIGRAAALAFDGDHGHAFAVGDIEYWPLVRRAVVLHVLVWSQKLRHVQALALRAAEAAPLGRVLTANDVTAYNRVLIDSARRVGVSSVGIQHGMTAEPNGHTMVHVDTLATWGEQAEEWYRAEAAKLGREQTARFVATGNPRYDALSSQTPLVAGRQFTVCICTGFLTDFSVSASEYENLLMIETVLDWARRHPDVRVIHKIHPGEELAYYAEAARVLGWDPLQLTTVGEPILHDLLRQSQVMVSAYSSTVLESIALGTPAVIFDAITQRILVHTPAHRIGGIPGVAVASSTQQMSDLLDGVKSGPPADRDRLRGSAELRAFLSTLDGGAAARVAALVGRT